MFARIPSSLIGALASTLCFCGLGCSDAGGYQPIMLAPSAAEPVTDGSTGGAPSTGTPTGGAPLGGAPGSDPVAVGGSTAGVGGAPSGSCTGWASRYWDCCKPHCAWQGNVSGTPVRQCGSGDVSIASAEPDTVQSACNGGPAHMCHGMAPWVSPTDPNLSYGYAAVTNTGNVCGRCYRLTFNGTSHNGGNNAGAQALLGKQMIVQVTNVGGLQTNQFDLLIPGGGVGDFNACANQWGTADIGAQYGGLLTTCQQELGYNAAPAAYQACVAARCDAVFGGRFPQLHAGCRWFIDWFQVADNPAFTYEPVTCPGELTSASGLTPLPAGGC